MRADDYAFQERAAIMEFDAGLPHHRAEALARSMHPLPPASRHPPTEPGSDPDPDYDGPHTWELQDPASP